MIKIAISGKARSGKDTLGKLLIKELGFSSRQIKKLAFADPIKHICKIMFPTVDNKHLFGPSEYRTIEIQNALSDGKPLTIRQNLLDVGTYARKYNEDIWINNFNYEYLKNQDKKLFIVPDLRFRNEIEYLKRENFFLIRIKRQASQIINHISETGQDDISDDEFDIVINNDYTLLELKQSVLSIIPKIINKFE